MSKRPLYLDMLTDMAGNWHDTTSAMITITVGMVLQKLEVTSIDIPLGGVDALLTRYEVDREYFKADDDGTIMRITLKERTNETTADVADDGGARDTTVEGTVIHPATPGTHE